MLDGLGVGATGTEAVEHGATGTMAFPDGSILTALGEGDASASALAERLPVSRQEIAEGL